MKKLVCLFIVLAISLAAPAAMAQEGDPYTDMPSAPWAREAVLKAREYGLMNGVGESEFGTGSPLSRQEFVTILCRMLGWDAGEDGADAFDDISDVWGRGYINAAASMGAVDAGGDFRPTDPITRREMAVMLVRALGLSDMAGSGLSLPFTDVAEDAGFIAVAYDIDMTNGTSPTTFEPEGGAAREQAAAMLVRVYERYISKTQWTHAFYAISSFSQLELAKRFDAVTLGWSRLSYSEGTARLETAPRNGNVYYVPDGYTDVVTALEDAGVETYLGVFMDDSGGALSAFLADPAARLRAVSSILDEAALLGADGVTLDLEGLRSGARDDLTSFAGELDAVLEGAGLKLNVAVMPTTADGVYFDGYDYRALGEYADRLILMAHDYAPLSMPESLLGSEFYKNAALTPIASVYRSLRDITDPATGVDPGKVVLNLSMTAMAWETDEAGRLVSALPVYPTMETVRSRILGGAGTGWSETYKNPYLTYVTESGQSIFLWYEDQRSVEAKLELARLMGVNSVSVWRLGLVPEYTDEGLFLNVADAILGDKSMK